MTEKYVTLTAYLGELFVVFYVSIALGWESCRWHNVYKYSLNST